MGDAQHLDEGLEALFILGRPRFHLDAANRGGLAADVDGRVIEGNLPDFVAIGGESPTVAVGADREEHPKIAQREMLADAVNDRTAGLDQLVKQRIREGLIEFEAPSQAGARITIGRERLQRQLGLAAISAHPRDQASGMEPQVIGFDVGVDDRSLVNRLQAESAMRNGGAKPTFDDVEVGDIELPFDLGWFGGGGVSVGELHHL